MADSHSTSGAFVTPETERDLVDRQVLATQIEMMADRVGRIPVQLDDAATLRRAARAIRFPMTPLDSRGQKREPEAER